MADVAIPSSGGGSVVAGTYNGDGAKTRIVSLGFTPSAVLISGRGRFTSSSYRYFNALVVPGVPVESQDGAFAEIVSNGFKVSYTDNNNATNDKGVMYYYLAFR